MRFLALASAALALASSGPETSFSTLQCPATGQEKVTDCVIAAATLPLFRDLWVFPSPRLTEIGLGQDGVVASIWKAGPADSRTYRVDFWVKTPEDGERQDPYDTSFFGFEVSMPAPGPIARPTLVGTAWVIDREPRDRMRSLLLRLVEEEMRRRLEPVTAVFERQS
jgi:hypothetical protein